MKKMILILSLVLMFSISSFALFGVGGFVGSYGLPDDNMNVIGAELSLPSFLPIMTTRIQASVGSYNNISAIPVLVQQALYIPLTGIYGGLEAGFASLTLEVPEDLVAAVGSESVQGGVPLYGAFVGYEHGVAPFVKLFGEISYNIIPLSQIHKEIDDENVLAFKAGVRAGI